MYDQLQLWMAFSSACVFGAVFCFAREWVPLWDRIAGGYVADLLPTMRDLGMDERQVGRLMRGWGLALAFVVVVFGILLAMPPVALGLLGILLIVPRIYLDYRISERRRALRDQLVRGTTALANSARAGMALVEGIATVALETPAPLGIELRRIAGECRAGRPLTEVLRETQQRLAIESFTLFASALTVCLERGGKVTLALERIGADLQELQRLEGKLEADTAAGRKLTFTLGAFPLLFLVGFTLLDPVSMGYLYNTFLGQIVLLVVGVIVYLSCRWCLRILTIQF